MHFTLKALKKTYEKKSTIVPQNLKMQQMEFELHIRLRAILKVVGKDVAVQPVTLNLQNAVHTATQKGVSRTQHAQPPTPR